MKYTGKYCKKPYECTECGNEFETGTNHWGDIYPTCNVCNKQTVCKCTEEVPKGYKAPPKWDKITFEIK